MANERWSDKAADTAARAAQRRETGGASVPAGGAHAPDDPTIPGAPERPRRAPAREEAGRADDVERGAPVSGTSAEEAPELLGERSDYPAPFGDEPE